MEVSTSEWCSRPSPSGRGKTGLSDSILFPDLNFPYVLLSNLSLTGHVCRKVSVIVLRAWLMDTSSSDCCLQLPAYHQCNSNFIPGHVYRTIGRRVAARFIYRYIYRWVQIYTPRKSLKMSLTSETYELRTSTPLHQTGVQAMTELMLTFVVYSTCCLSVCPVSQSSYCLSLTCRLITGLHLSGRRASRS